MGNDIYMTWQVAHTWIVSNLSNLDVFLFMSVGEYPLSSFFIF